MYNIENEESDKREKVYISLVKKNPCCVFTPHRNSHEKPEYRNTGQPESTESTVKSCLTDTPLLRTLAITDKIQIPNYRGLTENDSWYYGLSLFRTQNDVPKGRELTRGTRAGREEREERGTRGARTGREEQELTVFS